jgi:hypothetical protein
VSERPQCKGSGSGCFVAMLVFWLLLQGCHMNFEVQQIKQDVKEIKAQLQAGEPVK